MEVEHVAGPDQAEPLRDSGGRFAERDADVAAEIDSAQAKRTALESAPELSLRDDLDAKEWRARFEERRAIHDESPSALKRIDEEAARDESDADAQQTLESYTARMNAFEAKTPDFREKVSALMANHGWRAEVGHAVQLAILEDENGPEIAYRIASDEKLVEKLSHLSPTAAVAAVGRLAAEIEERSNYYNDWSKQHFSQPISQAAMSAYQQRAAEVSADMSPEELRLLDSVVVRQDIAHTAIALKSPETLRYLLNHVDELSELNRMEPLAAAAEVARIRKQLADGGPSGSFVPTRQRQNLPAPISPIRKSVPTDRGLSDDLPAHEWHKRFLKLQEGWRK